MKKDNENDKCREIEFNDYKSGTFSIKKFRHIQLKNACKKYKLKITGKKQILFERLVEYFLKIDSCIKIQSTCRKHFSNSYVFKRGPAIHNRELCNNNTDFVTLEPINEIPFEYFFSYKDENEFIYGFNIVSLIQSLKKNKNFENPYNRCAFNKKLKNLILHVYNCSYILNSDFKNENTFYVKPTKNNINQRIIRVLTQHANYMQSTVDNYQPFFDRRLINMTEEMENQLNFIQESRTLNTNNRIIRLFMEFDNLGNYTNSEWFSNLTHIQYIRLYRTLYDIWIIRGQLTYQVKRSICPFHDPFDGIFPRRFYHDTMSTDQIRKGCLIVMENFTYSGINIDYRKIGALHVLTALTLVSIPARQTMPWLYESIV